MTLISEYLAADLSAVASADALGRINIGESNPYPIYVFLSRLKVSPYPLHVCSKILIDPPLSGKFHFF